MTVWTREMHPMEEDFRRDALVDVLTRYNQDPDPKLVELRQGARQVVPGAGSFAPLVVLVGEAPGAEEDAKGQPFVGPAGRLLRELLAEVGLDPEIDCWITNVVRYRPPDNRTPRSSEVAASVPYLLDDLYVLDPLLVVPLGATAIRALWPGGPTITNGRGRPEHVVVLDEGDEGRVLRVPLLPTWHPSAALRDDTGQKAFDLGADLRLAADLVAPGRDA